MVLSIPTSERSLWRDPAATVADRVAVLIADMTLEEKVAQLVGLWVRTDQDGGDVAPHQSDLASENLPWDEATRHGLGQLTRPLGSSPVEPQSGAEALARSQRSIQQASRHGIPALVHEECLTGFSAWQATVYPVPPSWGATFDTELIQDMAGRIGRSMRAAGIHQGLAPVLDVVRDYRWGRTEETISEDPYLVSSIGSAYVRGLESSGLISTLKHFPGYAASRAGRNLAPVSIGPRELADVIFPPFEAALRYGGARSVMHAYTDLDGIPSAADAHMLTDVLRRQWGFTGTVVADYFGVRFLQKLHRVAATGGEAAVLALRAGVDVELPSGDTFLEPLLAEIRSGVTDAAVLDAALHRVLSQKVELGLLDPEWRPDPVGPVVLDDEESRQTALHVAREALTLLSNDGTLPLAEGSRIALVGPLADDAAAMLGCYSFPTHVGVQHPESPRGIQVPTVRDELSRRREVSFAADGDTIFGDSCSIEEAASVARSADVCVLAVGDESGLFGRGTSGEGCDAADLALPGTQPDLLEAVLATETPVVLLLLTGRPYALGSAARRAAAVLQGFFLGQKGAQAVAEVLTGEVNPSGRLPMSLPSQPGTQPGTYLSAPLGRASGVSSVDPTPEFPFGHGLSYTFFEWNHVELTSGDHWDVDGAAAVEVTVSNVGDRAGTEVVQVYLHDRVAQVTRPELQLIGFARVPLQPGQSATVRFRLSADLTSFTGADLRRIVEPGEVEIRVGRSSAEMIACLPATLTGPEREAGPDREMFADVSIEVHP